MAIHPLSRLTVTSYIYLSPRLALVFVHRSARVRERPSGPRSSMRSRLSPTAPHFTSQHGARAQPGPHATPPRASRPPRSSSHPTRARTDTTLRALSCVCSRARPLRYTTLCSTDIHASRLASIETCCRTDTRKRAENLAHSVCHTQRPWQLTEPHTRPTRPEPLNRSPKYCLDSSDLCLQQQRSRSRSAAACNTSSESWSCVCRRKVKQ
jgi:hypothetical protein